MKGLYLKYFVLKPKGKDKYARASREAMQTYSRMIRKYDPYLADDLDAWVIMEEATAKL